MLLCFGGVCVPLNMLVPFIVGEPCEKAPLVWVVAGRDLRQITKGLMLATLHVNIFITSASGLKCIAGILHRYGYFKWVKPQWFTLRFWQNKWQQR